MGITPANEPEASVIREISADLEQQGVHLKELYSDRTYLSSHLVREHNDELEIYCKAWPVREGKLFSGKHGELWDRAFEDQVHRASCLHLIMAAIAAWNAVYLSQAVEELKKRGEAVPEEYLPHITPLGWGAY